MNYMHQQTPAYKKRKHFEQERRKNLEDQLLSIENQQNI